MNLSSYKDFIVYADNQGFVYFYNTFDNKIKKFSVTQDSTIIVNIKIIDDILLMVAERAGYQFFIYDIKGFGETDALEPHNLMTD